MMDAGYVRGCVATRLRHGLAEQCSCTGRKTAQQAELYTENVRISVEAMKPDLTGILMPAQVVRCLVAISLHLSGRYTTSCRTAMKPDTFSAQGPWGRLLPPGVLDGGRQREAYTSKGKSKEREMKIDETKILNVLSGLVIILLMVLVIIGNAPLMFIVSVTLLYFGFLLFPAQRRRGAIAAIAACFAAALLALLLWLQLLR